MVDTTVNSDLALGASRATRRTRGGDFLFGVATKAAAIFVVLIFFGLMFALIDGAMPEIKNAGWSFLYSTKWNPVTEQYGAVPLVYGTLVTSFIAMAIALPVGIGIAIFLTEICPRPLRRTIGIAIELLAGIPSIIYGIWGLFVFAPWFGEHVQPWIIDTFANVPVLRDLFGGPAFGIGMFTASLILSIMILPFIAAVTRDVFETVPSILKEAAYGLGSTTWEVMHRIVLPFARPGVIGAAMLALGRALGETMAVTFVIGNGHRISANLFAPGTTISAAIANEFTEAVGDFYQPALIEAGLILYFITFLVLAAAQIMLRSLEKRAGGRS